MALVKTKVKLKDLSPEWGLVVVGDASGAVVREYEITVAEAQAVHGGNGHPPGMTAEEWTLGNSFVASRPCREFGAVVNPDGWLIVNHKTDKSVANRIAVSLMRVPPHQWEQRGSETWIEASVAAQMGV